MKNTKIILIAAICGLICLDMSFAASNSPALLPDAEVSKNVDMGSVKDIVNWAFDTIRNLLGLVAVLFGTLALTKLVTAQGNEEGETTAKRWLEYGLIGLVIFAMSKPVSAIFGVGSDNMFMNDPNGTADAVNSVIMLAISFIRYLLGTVAVIAFVYAGFTMITSSSNDDLIGKQKKIMLWSTVALLIFMISGEIIKTFYGSQGDLGVDPTQGNDTVAGITNLLLGFVGMGAVLALTIAAIMYTVSGENDGAKEKAKKIIIGTLVAIVIAYASYTIVSEVINATGGNISL